MTSFNTKMALKPSLGSVDPDAQMRKRQQQAKRHLFGNISMK